MSDETITIASFDQYGRYWLIAHWGGTNGTTPCTLGSSKLDLRNHARWKRKEILGLFLRTFFNLTTPKTQLAAMAFAEHSQRAALMKGHSRRKSLQIGKDAGNLFLKSRAARAGYRTAAILYGLRHGRHRAARIYFNLRRPESPAIRFVFRPRITYAGT